MCGRVALYTPPERLARIYGARLADDVDEAQPGRFNLPPTEPVLAMVTARQKPVGPDAEPNASSARPVAVARRASSGDDRPAPEGHEGDWRERRIRPFRWGLVPSWAKDTAVGNRMFNARAESLLEKAAFRNAFTRRRCIVLADGFYEWGPPPPGSPKRTAKIPYFFRRADGEPLALAGVWEVWRDPRLPAEDPANRLRSCAIVTAANGPDLAGIHDRAPVVIERDDIDTWIGAAPADLADLVALTSPAPAGVLVRHRVRPLVNKVDNDGPELIEKVTQAEEGQAGAPPGPVYEPLRFDL